MASVIGGIIGERWNHPKGSNVKAAVIGWCGQLDSWGAPAKVLLSIQQFDWGFQWVHRGKQMGSRRVERNLWCSRSSCKTLQQSGKEWGVGSGKGRISSGAKGKDRPWEQLEFPRNWKPLNNALKRDVISLLPAHIHRLAKWKVLVPPLIYRKHWQNLKLP